MLVLGDDYQHEQKDNGGNGTGVEKDEKALNEDLERAFAICAGLERLHSDEHDASDANEEEIGDTTEPVEADDLVPVVVVRDVHGRLTIGVEMSRGAWRQASRMQIGLFVVVVLAVDVVFGGLFEAF